MRVYRHLIAEKSIYKGITSEGPNKLRKGKPGGRSRKIKSKRHKGKLKNEQVLLSTRRNSSLRNQLAAIRQASRPTVNHSTHAIVNGVVPKVLRRQKVHGTKHGVKGKNSQILQQKLEWNKLRSAPHSFKLLSKRSFLFTVEQVRSIDKITIYYIGLDGFAQLCEIDSRFERFQQTLFESKRYAVTM